MELVCVYVLRPLEVQHELNGSLKKLWIGGLCFLGSLFMS